MICFFIIFLLVGLFDCEIILEYILIVSVEDVGKFFLNFLIKVIVRISDSNDNFFEFNKVDYIFFVLEN